MKNKITSILTALFVLGGFSEKFLTTSANAQTWSPVGSGMDYTVMALDTFNGKLYAGGQFSTAGGNPARGIAGWNGTTWSSLGTGMGFYVNALAVYKGELYAGGSFNTAGGNPARNIAKWNGTTWSPVGSGMNFPVAELAVYNGELYAGGMFTTAGGNPAKNIARWNGTTWSPVGSGMDSRVLALGTFNGKLYAGGNFSTADGNPANRIAAWDGSSWSPVGTGMNFPVGELAVYNGELYAGGQFTNAGGNPANRIAKWNGSTWSAVGTGMSDYVTELAVYNGELYAGGAFTNAGGSPANNIARWNGSSWSAVGTGVDFPVNALTVYNGELYAGGWFTTAGGNPANKIAKWTNIPKPPVTQFSANPTFSCSGNVTFSDQSVSGITSWLWDFGDGSTSTLQNPIHTYTASGTYSVSLKTTNATGNTTLVKPNYINVSLSSAPLAPASCNPATTAYCCGFGITNFTFNKINNNSPDGSEGYADYTCTRDTVTPGQWYPVSVKTAAPAAHNVRVWIDFNNDGSFNPSGELVFSKDNSFTASGTIYIPASATLNTLLRLRVSADHDLNPAPGPCTDLKYGQAEDYAIVVIPNNNPPVAGFFANTTLTCSGNVAFTDQSQNVPDSWQWNFGDGSTSVSQNPTHTYTSSGTYSVTLTAANSNGNNTLSKSNYITVTLGNIPVSASCLPSTFSYCCGYGIYEVTFNTIGKLSPDASEGYQDFSCSAQTTLTEGKSYNISIQTNPSLTQDTKVWIDYNNDGTFNQQNELIFTSLNMISPVGSITIPTGTATLNTILRMRVASDASGNNPGPCTALLQGQAEDYGVTIQKFVNTDELAVGSWQLAVYPNPFSESAVLAVLSPFFKGGQGGFPPFPKGSRGNLVFVLYDLYGRVVKEQPIVNNRAIIERGNLNAGIYFYSVRNVNEMIGTGKIIIQ